MKKILFIFTVILSAFFTGCEVEETIKKESVNTHREGFSLSYHVKGIISAVTRSTIPVGQGEDTINSLYILFFENTPDGSGRFIEAVDGMPGYQNSLGGSGKLDIAFPEGSALSHSDNYKILFCANITDYSIIPVNNVEELNEYCSGQTEGEVAKMLLQISGVTFGGNPVEEQGNNNKKMLHSNLPMSGSTVKRANEENLTVEMSHLVSRFDVFCQATGYELASASLWNAYTGTTIWGNASNDFSGSHTQRYYGVNSNSNGEITSALYTFENQVPDPELNDGITTCLILGLRKAGESSVKYFRANIHPNYMGQELKRSNMYRTSVLKVNGQGADNEREAYLSNQKLLDIDINGWMLDQNENIQYNGENILVIPTKEITLFPEGDQRTYKIFTLGEGHTLSILEKNLPSHITATLNSDNELTIQAAASGTDSQGVIKLGFAGMSADIHIRQEAYHEEGLMLNEYELYMSAHAGVLAETIEVAASGAWIAEIYNGTNFSFSSAATQVASIEGVGDGYFNIHTIKSNLSSEAHYSFVQVKLKENPQINRVIILKQGSLSDLSLMVSPTQITGIPAAGGTTQTITVESNAKWTARIIDSHTNAGFNSNVNSKTLQGTGNETFTVKLGAITATNITPVAIVEITIDGTSITKTVRISQSAAALTLSVTPTQITGIPAAGGTTQTITVTSNGKWKAEIMDNGTNAGFDTNVNSKTLEWTGSKAFKVTLGPVRTVSTNPTATIRISLQGTSITKTVVISQIGLSSDTALKVLTTTDGISNLANTSSPFYTRYVYNLGQNMRNANLFGPAGTVYMPGYYKFEQGAPTAKNVADANIYQVIYAPSTTEVNTIKTAMNNDKSKFLMISYNQGIYLSQTLNSFFPYQGYGLVSLNCHPSDKRYFNQSSTYSNHPLITYLLKDGPFTSSKLNADNIWMYGSYDNLNAGVSTWPSTFIPIIMVKHPISRIEYCVFGIDPTNRMIWISDPGIFGSSTSSDANYANYRSGRTENIAFLNNVIAWITTAALEGDTFIKKYK